MKNIEIITTSDGSHSLLNTALNETYHSHHGALQESIHVFIKNGLDYFFNSSSAKAVRIFEVGFGTGLNALLTLQQALRSGSEIFYTSIEAFPLERDIWSALNYADADTQAYFELLHTAAWNEQVSILPNFHITKLNTILQAVSLQTSSFDVVYYDAFAPNKQPEMWELPLLIKVADSLTSGGVFVTYCAKGQLKRDLRSLNLKVETLEGPPGKKEMVRALKS
jgi:tRNA U34 5-methylaminomethyl-2-thiouridine-forming methyltransferase MnmC